MIGIHDDHIIGRLDGSDKHIRFDFVGERFDDVDKERSQAVVHIKPGLRLAPKTGRPHSSCGGSCVHRLIKRVDTSGNPYVHTYFGESIPFSLVLKDYDILTEKQSDELLCREVKAKPADANKIPLSSHLFVFKNGECVGKVESRGWFVDHTNTLNPISVDEHEFVTIKRPMM